MHPTFGFGREESPNSHSFWTCMNGKLNQVDAFFQPIMFSSKWGGCTVSKKSAWRPTLKKKTTGSELFSENNVDKRIENGLNSR